jgi:tetratricopeptide (TPR) repeat protein
LHFKNLILTAGKILFLITIILFISVSEGKSQDDLTLEEVQQKLDSLSEGKKWNEIIVLGNKILKEDGDFYSLRVRLGEAYFEKGKYIYAIENFEKALEVGFDEQFILEKLYYSYKYIGRNEDANYIFSKLSVSRKDRIRPLNNVFIESFNTEAGTSLSNDESKNGNFNTTLNPDQYGEQIINKNSFLFDIGLSQMPVEILNVSYEYTYQNLQKEKVIDYNGIKTIDNYNQYQSHFYNSFNIRISNGFVISPAGRFISTKENTISASIDSSSPPPDYNGGSGSTNYSLTPTQNETSIENFILSLSLVKYVSLYKFGINGSFSYLNEIHQSQIGASASYFPSGSKSFYSTSNIVLHNQNSVTEMIFTQLFGGKLRKGLFLEGYATIGKVYNYNEENGYIVFNNSDATSFKFGLNMKYAVSNSTNLYLIYLNQQRERNYTVYNIPQKNPVLTQKLTYSVNTILAGVKINF